MQGPDRPDDSSGFPVRVMQAATPSLGARSKNLQGSATYGLRQGFSWMCALLRRDFRGTLARYQRAPLRAGLRPAAMPESARVAAQVEEASSYLRQLDERPVPRAHPGGRHRAGTRRDVSANHHVYQVLTKRHERLAELAPNLP